MRIPRPVSRPTGIRRRWRTVPSGAPPAAHALGGGTLAVLGLLAWWLPLGMPTAGGWLCGLPAAWAPAAASGQAVRAPWGVEAVCLSGPAVARPVVATLATEFDSKFFAERERAYRTLYRLGPAAVTPLQELLSAPGLSAEKRHRCRQLVARLRSETLRSGFQRLAAEGEAGLSLDEAMWWVARIVDFDTPRHPIDQQLNALARRVQRRLGKTPAHRLPPGEVLEAMRQVLFVEFGLRGATAKYDHPHSSSIARVLRDRKGLPILLSHIVIAVGERLRLPLVGLQVPGRYMLKYPGDAAPQGSPREDLIVDAFGGGKVLSVAEVRRIAPGFDSGDLQPSSKRASVARLLRNLASDYEAVGERERAVEAAQYLLLFDE